MDTELLAISSASDEALQSLLEQALMSSARQLELLSQPELLGGILNTVSARQWLFEVSRQTEDPKRAIKARLLIVLIMQYSGKIWRGTASTSEDYDEALARTWEWFSKNLKDYVPERSSFVTWFNQKLKFVILDILEEKQRREQREQSLIFEEGNQLIDLPDPKASRIEVQIFYNQLVELVKRDPTYSLRNCRMQQYPHVTCQKVILEILQVHPTSPNIPWETLTEYFGVNLKSLRGFCNRTAFPHFKRFCHRHGI